MGHKRFMVLSIILVLFTFTLNSFSQSDTEFSSAKKLYLNKNFNEAKHRFITIFNEDNSNDSAAFYIGKIFFQQGEYDESIQWFERAIAVNDSSSEYYHQIGLVYGLKAQNAGLFKKPGLAKSMKKNVERAIKLDPNNIAARFSLLNYLLQAPGFMGGGKDKAKQQAEEIKKIDEENGYIAMASVYESEKQLDLAENALRQVINMDSTNLDNYMRLGGFFTRTHQYNQAIKTFENIISINPQKMDAYYQIGKVGAVSGQFLDKAESSMTHFLTKAQDQNDDYTIWAHYRLGMIYEKMKKPKQAIDAYQAALNLDPAMKLAKEALKKLQ